MEPKDLDVIPKKKTTAYPSTSESAKRLGLEPRDLDVIPKKKTTGYPMIYKRISKEAWFGTQRP